MNVRAEYDHQIRIDLGDLVHLTRELDANGLVADMQHVLKVMSENDIRGLTFSTDESVEITPVDA